MIREALKRIVEGGEEAGELELAKISIKEAREYGEKAFEKQGQTLDEEIPKFEDNFKKAKALANLGHSKRKDMPVIDTPDVKLFQKRLEQGYIDVNAPFSKEDKSLSKSPFPEGLKGKKAKLWLENGLKKHDGDADDDKVKVAIKKVKVGDLKPIQKQIYYDKSMGLTAEAGIESSIDFLQNKSIFIASADYYIIDGHHRFLSGVLIDANMKVDVLVIDMPIKELLPLSLAYGDSIQNPRNEAK